MRTCSRSPKIQKQGRTRVQTQGYGEGSVFDPMHTRSQGWPDSSPVHSPAVFQPLWWSSPPFTGVKVCQELY